MNDSKFFVFYKKYGIYIILAAVVLFFSIFARSFLSFVNFMNVLRQVSTFGIAVAAVTFIMISGGADLSVGGQVAVNGIIGGALMVYLNLPIFVVVICCMGIGILFGVFNSLVAVKFNMHPMVVTLGSMLMLQGLAYVISGGYPVFGLPPAFKYLGQGYISIVPVPVVIFALVIACASFILRRTYFGRELYAMGGNPEAARLAGVSVERMRVLVYALAGFITSISALITLSRTNSAQPGAGATYPFDCMTAAVLGGISFAGGEGTIGSAMVGVIIIGILNNGLLLMSVDSNWQGVIKGMVLILAVGVDSLQRKEKKVKVIASASADSMQLRQEKIKNIAL